EVDIAGLFVASEQRAAVVEFTHCLGFSKLGIITGVISSDKNLFLYANVFSWKVWLCLLLAIIGIALVAELIFNVTCSEKKSDDVSLFASYFWLFWRYLVGRDGGSTNNWALVHIWNMQSFRILLSTWLLGPVIICLLSFQGSITSTFAVTKLRPVIADLDELNDKTNIVPVTSRGSAVQICFKTSPSHSELWKRMENNSIAFKPEAIAETMLKIEKGTHILIIDYIYALHIVSDYVKRTGRCSIQVEEEHFCQSFIALAVQKFTSTKTVKKINSKLNYIIQAKLTDRWMNRVYNNYTHCTRQATERKPLSIKDILGGFVIWSIGIAVSFLVLISEIVESRRKRNIKK
ncbi:uncharacterized protein NPIL_429161, partial [Nephila pilipes]